MCTCICKYLCMQLLLYIYIHIYMTPFKQSNLSVWSLLSWHPTHTHLWVRCYPICISRFLICQRMCYSTPASLLFFTNIVVWIPEYLNSNHFEYQWIGKLRLKRKLKSNAPQTKKLRVTKSAAGNIFLRRKQNLQKKMENGNGRRQDYFDWILMDTLSCWCSMQIIIHKSQVRIFFL